MTMVQEKLEMTKDEQAEESSGEVNDEGENERVEHTDSGVGATDSGGGRGIRTGLRLRSLPCS